MSVIDFPSSPTLGATYSAGNRMWRYDGSKWVSVLFTSPQNGSLDGGAPSGRSGLIISNGNPSTTFSGVNLIDCGTP